MIPVKINYYPGFQQYFLLRLFWTIIGVFFPFTDLGLITLFCFSLNLHLGRASYSFNSVLPNYSRKKSRDTGGLCISIFPALSVKIYFCVFRILFASSFVNLNPMRIRIQLFTSMLILIRIRIHEAKPMRIQADPDPDQNCESQKVEFFLALKGRKHFFCKFWPIFMLPDPDPHSQYGSGSKAAKWMRIQVDPDPGPDPQHCKYYDFTKFRVGSSLPACRSCEEPNPGQRFTPNMPP